MINTKHLLKVAMAWISAVYAICFTGVALFPSSRELFMKYALHSDININLGQNIITFPTFISGLIIWNIVALLAVGLFAVLFNKIKQ